MDVPRLPKEKLEVYSSETFDKWEKYLSDHLKLQDFSISLEVEDGSINLKAVICTALVTLYIGIGQYGSFITGIQTISSQVKGAGEYLSVKACEPHESEGLSYRVRKKSGTLGQIERLFVKVKKNELTVEQAIDKAEEILGEEAESSPEFVNELKESLKETPKYPEQLYFETIELDEGLIPEKKKQKPRPGRAPRKRPEPNLHNHIKIWRETKKGKKKY